jgi:hypothetical protein
MLRRGRTRVPQWLIMLLASMAGLLLEVGYTRIVSFKLFHPYVFLVIGLSLLGIGSGGIVVAIWKPLQRTATERIVALCSIWGALSVVAGYLIVARIPLDTIAIWDYGTWRSFSNLGALGLMCLALFGTFIALGITIATLLGRARDRVGRLYFADLVGAGAGALLAIPLIVVLNPPAVVMLSALVFAVVGLMALPAPPSAYRTPLSVLGSVTAVVLVLLVVFNGVLPDVRPEETKADPSGSIYSEWGPVFRVDVSGKLQDPLGFDEEVNLLSHDGTFGSSLFAFDGDVDELTRFERDHRSVPFDILGQPPGRELIIGSAGGNEILASLYHGAERIEAVELNPVTVSLLTDRFVELTGNLPDRPEVDLHQGDGRTYLARSDRSYDLVWFVAPDSYAATNAASSSAFVLSESYLYTSEMIEETLGQLSDDGIMVTQFGELSFQDSPNRTSRYVVTARDALEAMGVEDPSAHIIVAAELTPNTGDLTTLVVKRTPFTPEEVERFGQSLEDIARADAASRGDHSSQHVAIYAPGQDATGSHVVTQLAGGTEAEVSSLVAANPTAIGAVEDDQPFFWHFEGFADVIGDIFEPIRDDGTTVLDLELGVGERVLLLLFGVAALYAAAFLLLPFVTVRRKWAALPFKARSAVYFACLGLGFMFYEITMIQRLVLFLGFPTLSLTVTLAAILVFTGLGALASHRLADRPRTVMPLLLAVLAALTLFYQIGLGRVTDGLLEQGLAVRIVVSLVVLAPLGLCLGMFLPFGMRLVSELTEFGEEYVAWSWAVNGFFSVVGSVLTTILSMTFGFGIVQYLALATYAVAVTTFLLLHTHRTRRTIQATATPFEESALVAVEAPTPV